MSKIYQKSYPAGKNAGFTLIELLVVVLIIGILAAVALPKYELAVEKSRMAEAVTMISAIAKAEQLYYMANGEYTDDIEELDVDFPGEKVYYYANGVQTKNFVCRPVRLKGDWTDALSSCNRLPRETLYALVYLKTGEIVCRYYNDKGKKFCQISGFTSQYYKL